MSKYPLKMPSPNARGAFFAFFIVVIALLSGNKIREIDNFSGEIFLYPIVIIASIGTFLMSKIISYNTFDRPILFQLIFRPFFYWICGSSICNCLIYKAASYRIEITNNIDETMLLRNEFENLANFEFTKLAIFIIFMAALLRFVHFMHMKFYEISSKK